MSVLRPSGGLDRRFAAVGDGRGVGEFPASSALSSQWVAVRLGVPQKPARRQRQQGRVRSAVREGVLSRVAVQCPLHSSSFCYKGSAWASTPKYADAGRGQLCTAAQAEDVKQVEQVL